MFQISKRPQITFYTGSMACPTALNICQGDIEALARMTTDAYKELAYWEQTLPFVFDDILPSEPDISMKTDAYSIGWGAFCPTLSPKGQGKWGDREKNFILMFKS